MREKYQVVGNTNGRDVFCKKCGEPFENLYILEDFTDEEWTRFVVFGTQLDDEGGDELTRIAGLNGCPSCED